MPPEVGVFLAVIVLGACFFFTMAVNELIDHNR